MVVNNEWYIQSSDEVLRMHQRDIEDHKKLGYVLMNEKGITSLFICNKMRPVGIVHIHDLLRLSS